ncbi:hypothetical protein VTN31DRAFT_3330 [Thermomyces dupontii]|uniref:uncharacterized protein n=1 Tax=Talaromyces thermophilus TaxID=28565 RepID=UPI00374350D0
MPMLASPKQPSSRSKLQPGFFHSNCVHPESPQSTKVNAQDDDESSTSSGKAKVSVSSPDSKTSKTPGADPVATTSSGGSRPSS